MSSRRASRTRAGAAPGTGALRQTSASVAAWRRPGNTSMIEPKSVGLAEVRLAALRARRQQRGAVRDDGPSAALAGEGAGGGDVAGAERHGRMVLLQQVAAQQLAQALGVLGSEFAGGHQRVAGGVERMVERGGGLLRGAVEDVAELAEEAVEQVLLLAPLHLPQRAHAHERRVAEG